MTYKNKNRFRGFELKPNKESENAWNDLRLFVTNIYFSQGKVPKRDFFKTHVYV